MKKPFQVGDRVRVYGMVWANGESTGAPFSKTNGQVVNVDQQQSFNPEISVKDTEGAGMVFEVHPKQCRKLIKKERLRFWAMPDWIKEQLEPGRNIYCSKNESYRENGWIEFIEVKK